MTIKIDQLADAIVAVPGVTVEMLKVIAGAQTVTSTTFVNLTSISGSFSAPVAGTYLVDFQLMGIFGGSGSDQGRFRLVFDVGTGNEQYVGADNVYSNMAFNSAIRENTSIRGAVVLTSGSHTIKAQALKSYGTSVKTDALSAFRVDGTLVSGSGAGGVIKTEATDTGDRTGTGSSVTEITQLRLLATTLVNEVVFLSFVGDAKSAGGDAPFVYYQIDNDGWVPMAAETGTSGAGINDAWSYPVTVAASGEHQFKIGVKCFNNGAWELEGSTLTSRFSCLQFRGGLVPIQKDGVDVVGTPRALNFIGSGVSVDESTGVADIQLNEALTVPGVTVEMLHHVSSNTDTLSSATWADLGEGANLASGSFTAAAAGTYLGHFNATIKTNNWSQNRLRLVFDVGTGSEQIIGTDDSVWDVTQVDRLARTVPFQITLTAGLHTIKVQYKRVGGTTNGSYESALSSVQIYGSLVSGSGAGGLIKTECVDANTRSGTGSSVTEISQLALTVTTIANEVVNLVFTGDACPTAAGTPAIYYKIDSGLWVIMTVQTASAGWATNAHWSSWVTISDAGSHTIRLGVKNFEDSAWTLRGAVTVPSRYQCVQFRGGLVPVRNSGAVVLDTPAAFDFIGPGLIVTNSGGTARISTPEGDGYLKLVEQATDPVAHANDGYLYSKDVSGGTELFYMDNAGNVTEISKTGFVHTTRIQDRDVSPSLPMDGYILAWNAAASTWSPQVQDGYRLQTDVLPTKVADGFLKRDSGNTGWEEVVYGTNANTVCQGDDVRLSDSRTPTGAAAGDLSGTYPSPTVSKIVNRSISETVPLDGYVLAWNAAASTWSPQTQDAYMIQTRPISSAEPLDGYVLAWRSGQWEPETGDKLDLGWIPENYVPAVAPPYSDGTNQLTAHLSGIDGYLGNTGNAIDGHAADVVNPHVTTLWQAYVGSGSGAGRAIVADAGPVSISAIDGSALELDGYASLLAISDPLPKSDAGLVYGKLSDGYVELCYMDDYGLSTRITDKGFVYTDGYSGTVAISETISFVIENGLITNVIAG